MKKLPIWLHIIIALLAGFLLLMGLTYYLDSYTSHGKETEVPQVSKKNLKEAIKILESKGFKVDVDSTYRDSLPPLFVIKQFPEAGQKVKSGRTIQLVVNKGAAPMVEMPKTLGARLNIALMYLERSNLKLADTIFKPDYSYGTILQQLINGVDVKPGTLVRYGTKVTLVVGSGFGDQIYGYPDFWGIPLKRALAMMDTLGLSRGAIIVDPGTKDSLNALVYKQFPPQIDVVTGLTTVIRQGNTVDLWVSTLQRAREVDTLSTPIDETQLEEIKSADNKKTATSGSSSDNNSDAPKKSKKKTTPATKPIADKADKPTATPTPNDYKK
jgi:eukaryotic-like serine/threonine-protein kinase